MEAARPRVVPKTLSIHVGCVVVLPLTRPSTEFAKLVVSETAPRVRQRRAMPRDLNCDRPHLFNRSLFQDRKSDLAAG